MYACPDVVQPDRLREPSNAKPTSPANPWEARHPSGPTHFYLPVTHVSSKDVTAVCSEGEKLFWGVQMSCLTRLRWGQAGVMQLLRTQHTTVLPSRER